MSHHPLPPERLPRGLGLLLGLVTAVDFLSSLSLLFAHVPLRQGLGISVSGFVWTISVYAAASLAITPWLARLARRWHYRDLMAGGLALFVGGAALAGSADSLATLVVARALQGLGGGGLFTLARVYLQLAVPAELRPRQARGFILGLMGSIAPMAWLTAWLVSGWGWRAVFVLQGGFALLALGLLLGRVRAEEHTPGSLGRMDWVMVLCLTTGALLLMHGLEDLQAPGPQLHRLPALALALLLLAVALRRQLRDSDPLLDPRALRGRRYLAALGFYGLYYFINGASSFIYPRLLEEGAGLSTLQTGALLSLSATATVVLLPAHFVLAPRIADRRGLMATGFALAAVAMLWIGVVLRPGTPPGALLLPLLLKGCFPVLCVVQVAGLAYREVAHEDFAHAYALKNVLRQVVIALAAGLASQAWQGRAASLAGAQPPLLEGLLTARVGGELLAALALLCLLAAPLALRQERLR